MISWQINNICNFHCEYCNSRSFKGHEKKQGKDLRDLEKGFDSLGKDWIIHISGGEPFLEKDFISICEIIIKNHLISLNTNLSTSNVIDFANRIDPKKVLFISASVHIIVREKNDPLLKKFIEKVNYLQNRHFNIISTYVTHPSLFHRIAEDFKLLKLYGVNKVRIKAFRGIYNGKVYPAAFSDENISFLSTFANDYPEVEILNCQDSFYGLKCWAGTRSFAMQENGDLRRCGAVHRNYGNLFFGSFVPDQTPKPCPLKHCRCPYEGIRNVTSNRSSRLLTAQEVFIEGYFQLARIYKDPNLLFKLKDKILKLMIS